MYQQAVTDRKAGVSMNDVVLRLEGIRKKFGETQVLRGIDLEIHKGEFITLLGASGCGKTTTLRIVAGLEAADEGRVILDEEDITQLEPNKRNVNTVFQSYALFPHMSVAENIGYGLKLRRVPKKEIAAKVDKMLELVQLQGYGLRKPNQLSGGQRQRVAIARAVINEPKVLLLDEPLGALDLKLRRQMQLELKRFQKQLSIAFIYITHDQEEAINMSDRIAVMHQGVLEQLGTPNEIYYHPKTSYVADFVGNANIWFTGDDTYAIRTENVLMNGEAPCVYQAQVMEKSFAGGQLRIVFRLEDGQFITASRYGIDTDIREGSYVKIGWESKHAVPVEDDLEGRTHEA
jgi:spermidine/putrescine transport system ATP-binding protein